MGCMENTHEKGLRPGWSARVRGWVEMLRIPNLFTLPGDVIIGFLLTTPTARESFAGLGPGIAVGVLLYTGGLILNDVADAEVDARERPGRPIPSGRVGVAPAVLAASLCFLGAAMIAVRLGPAVLWAALSLLFLVLFYDLFAKDLRIVGPAVMGACRGFHVLLGATIASGQGFLQPVVICAAFMIGLYIFSVTLLASHEVSRDKVGAPRVFPPLSLILGGLMFVASLYPDQLDNIGRAVAAIVLSAGIAMYASTQFADNLRPVQHPVWNFMVPQSRPGTIGLLISLLIVVQAGVAVASPHEPWNVMAGFLLLVMWLLNRLTARFLYAS